LKYIPEQFRDDKEIGLIGVKQSWYALQYMSKQIYNDEDIMYAILHSDTCVNILQNSSINTAFLIRVILMGGRTLRHWLDNLEHDAQYMSIVGRYINKRRPQSLYILYNIRLSNFVEIVTSYLISQPEFVMRVLAMSIIPHHPKINKCRVISKLHLLPTLTELLFGLV